MNSYKKKFSLCIIAALCTSNQSTQASQYSKMIGKSVISAIKSQSTYPENDIYNHNIMNGSFFDNRAFKNTDEKRNFVVHNFKHMQVTTDINDELIQMLTHSGYSRQQLNQFMLIAQQVAQNQNCDKIDLRHLERGYQYLEECIDEFNLEGHLDKYSHNERLQIATHESGHAFELVDQDTGSDLKWVSIQSNNKSLGYVHRFITTKQPTEQQQKNCIGMLLAGGIAEQIFGFPEQQKFDNYEETLDDFLKRGTTSDWSRVKQHADNLGLVQAQNNRADCLWSSSKTLDKDLTLADNFFDTYATCTDIHLNEKAIHKNKCVIIHDQYRAKEKSVTQSQPIISAIAQELLVKKVISGKRVKEIVKEMSSFK